jgi:hypothetical protein
MVEERRTIVTVKQQSESKSVSTVGCTNGQTTMVSVLDGTWKLRLRRLTTSALTTCDLECAHEASKPQELRASS